ncbi:MAG: ankyrin repeat domain-containing protein, partial [Lachnospiraceae bacterium]
DIFRICREDPALDSDSPNVQFLLALCVRDGRGIRKDEKTFQRVLEWCVQKGSPLAIGYQAGFERGRKEAALEAKNAAEAAERKATESAERRKPPKEPEKPVTVLFLTRPSKKARRSEIPGDSRRTPVNGQEMGGDSRRAFVNGQEMAGSDRSASVNGQETSGGRRKSENDRAEGANSTSSITSRASAVLDQLYFAADEARQKGLSEDFFRIHRVLDSDDEKKIRDFWECGEYDGFLARMREDERGEILADLLIKINQYQKKDRKELIEICRKMALRILEGKVYISDLQLATKNEDGEKENLSVLWFAVWLGDLVLARYLLRSGANPNLVRTSKLAGGVILNRYALGECILQGNYPMAKLLLEHGANVRKMDGRRGEDGSESRTSFLAYAVLRNSPESVRLLLERDTNPNEGYHYRDKEGKWHLQTALYLAVQHTKNLEIVKILLEGGANPASAGSLANVHGEMLTLLLKHT